MASHRQRAFHLARFQFNRLLSSSSPHLPDPPPLPTYRRVVVTGLGMVTPLGCGVETIWKRLVAGECGVRGISADDLRMEGFDSETRDHVFDQLTSKVAAVVPLGTAAGEFDENLWLSCKEHRAISRFIVYALCTVDEALRDANWVAIESTDKEMTGVSIGGGIASICDVVDAARMICDKLKRLRRLSPYFIPRILINMAAGHISMKYGFQRNLEAGNMRSSKGDI